MVMLVIIAFLVSGAINGTKSYDECLKDNFRLENACHNAKVMHDTGKKACELQGKPFNGKSC